MTCAKVVLFVMAASAIGFIRGGTNPLRSQHRNRSNVKLSLTRQSLGAWTPIDPYQKIEHEDVAGTYHVHYDMPGVPGSSAVVFEVALNAHECGYDGFTEVGASKNENFLVVCPYVQLKVQTVPTMALDR